MVAYVFRCAEDGPFEVQTPMGAAPTTRACPRCGADARRAFSAPMTRGGSASARALIESTQRSAHDPAVVSAPPPRTGAPRQRRAPRDPALQRLPRP